MSVVDELIGWVKKKPLILIRFDKDDSQSLHNSYQGFERLTFTKRHSVFQSINPVSYTHLLSCGGLAIRAYQCAQRQVQ